MSIYRWAIVLVVASLFGVSPFVIAQDASSTQVTLEGTVVDLGRRPSLAPSHIWCDRDNKEADRDGAIHKARTATPDLSDWWVLPAPRTKSSSRYGIGRSDLNSGSPGSGR